MNAEFRKGWRAACAAVASKLRGVEYQGPETLSALRELAAECEKLQPPKTMTVVDENGGRLL